ncbi:putative mitochondrial protein [Erysiphe necator]|uniref:MICOS complex subunit n=1 Tax=Uncinula necator TaxID=52586 RepID=A0A0B1PDC9_UNCNE|nr:putative mitochondrial protein [Erysiphe necator]
MAIARLIQRHVAPILTSGVIAGAFFCPSTILKAESPETLWSKKPIYDENEDVSTPTNSSVLLPGNTATIQKSKKPTVTDRVAVEIGKARLQLYTHISFLEEKLNKFMDSAFNLEESFTSTIASLAPEPYTGEKLMPGSLYVIVAAMAGSIIARRHNILVRATLPLAVGITAGWTLLPITSQNISNLVWKYEQKFPVIADSHIRTKQAIKKAEKMAKIHSQQVVETVNEKVGASRSAIEDWVSRGK